jgi:hypothetical protein
LALSKKRGGMCLRQTIAGMFKPKPKPKSS